MASYDVCIVGGGFSGLYAAYRLSTARPGSKIALLEKSPRLGGRIFTHRHGNHVLEYGPMRYELELQPRFSGLLRELGIPTKPFPGYTSSPIHPNYNRLAIKEVMAIEANKHTMPPAFALLKHGLSEVLGYQWNISTDSIKNPKRCAEKKWLKEHGTFQGRPLQNHGVWDTLAHVLSKEALDFVREHGTFYHMIHANPNAANHMPFLLDMLATQATGLVTVDGGSCRIIEELALRVKDRVQLFSQAEVTDMVENSSQATVGIWIKQHNMPLTCRHAVLACPKRALEHIRGMPQNVQELLGSVDVIDLYKVFVVIENPPWGTDNIPQPNTNASVFPCREVHYGYDATDNTGLVMLYGDDPTLRYWAAFCSARAMDAPESNSNDHLRNHLYHYLRTAFPDHKSSMVIRHYSIMDWSRSPAASGVHLWRAGFSSEQVTRKLRAFGARNNMHICGEAYSDYQGFIEGCISSVDECMPMIMNSFDGPMQ